MDNAGPGHSAPERSQQQENPSEINLTGISCTSTTHTRKPAARDGCTSIVVQGGHGDRGVDIIGLTADG
ncbi:hypothetical protein AB0D38_09300 [Streptomyces sp. NPDC048279]|uniref:hypothetical protein n=1 Tax=Streptomyces sp. NPDC048279 TaxID=3154714 RepID=UPI00341819E5